MHDDDLLFAAMVGLAAGTLALVVFRRIGFGSVLALLATGLVVGPFGLALGGSGETLLQITELGIVFLLFVIGLEMEPGRLWSMRRAVLGLGSLQILLTGPLLAGVVAVAAGIGWQAALVTGFGLALSSTALVMTLVEERGELATAHGRCSFAVLLMQDLSIVPLLALVTILSGAGAGGLQTLWHSVPMIVLMIGLIYLLGDHALPRAFEFVASQRNSEAFAALAVLGTIASAWAMQRAGLSMAMGGFLLGMLLSRSRYRHQVEAEIGYLKGWLLSLFFVAVGMSIDLAALDRHLLTVIAVVVLLIATKTAVLLLLARAFGHGWDVSLRVALLLAQGGEFAFVLLGASRSAGLLDGEAYAIGILTISVSMAATPALARFADWLVARLPAAGPPGAGPGPDLPERHVVLAGMGRVGQSVAMMLETASIPYVAIDLNPEQVTLGRRLGRHVVYGNAGDPRLLRTVGLGHAAAVVVTLDNPAVAERVVEAIRTFHPDVRIIVRARDLAARDRMRRLGVSEAVPETVELSLTLGAHVLRQVGVADDTIDESCRQLRSDDFRLLAGTERTGSSSGR